ncbi:hypothetical protein Spb1_33770 [Planctopirus ephydatiae]|uniref:Uncharacterized protein n=1 Tax=Planctopirus ephydatiae TaxID=2528019 RepID=A0A518GS71_9PLAN|nr:hypothetical protein Spb1_33770 [Planctopirus ephydatiae]
MSFVLLNDISSEVVAEGWLGQEASLKLVPRWGSPPLSNKPTRAKLHVTVDADARVEEGNSPNHP